MSNGGAAAAAAAAAIAQATNTFSATKASRFTRNRLNQSRCPLQRRLLSRIRSGFPNPELRQTFLHTLTKCLPDRFIGEEHMSTAPAFDVTSRPLADDFERLFREHSGLIYRTARRV